MAKNSKREPIIVSEQITAAKIAAWATLAAAIIGALSAIIIAVVNKAQESKQANLPIEEESQNVPKYKGQPFIRSKPQKQENPVQELAGTTWRIKIGKIGSSREDFDSFSFLEGGAVNSSVISTDLTGWILSGSTIYIEFSNLGSPDDDVIMEFIGTVNGNEMEGRLKNRAVKSSQMEMVWEATRVQ